MTIEFDIGTIKSLKAIMGAIKSNWKNTDSIEFFQIQN